MIISGNDENAQGFDKCSKVKAWNGYYCENNKLALITFESFDEDKFKRILSPINVVSMNLTSRNVLNTFMDHLWDGFYTSMLRLSRFAALVQGGKGMVYTVSYTSTPPQRQQFTMRADYTEVIIRIRYTKPGAYLVYDTNGKEIKANAWDASISAPGMVKGAFCGENRYVGVINTLDFYLGPNCNISINPIDSVQASVRLNWTVSEFYKAGGTTQFQDRIAASLGIKPANIKIVSVYQGSVFVDFAVVEDSTGTLAKIGGVDKAQSSLTSTLTSGKVNLGAPIMSVSVTTIKPTPSVVNPTTTSTTNGGSSSTPVITLPTNTPVIKNDPSTTNTPTQTVPIKPNPQYVNNTIVQIHQEEESGSNNAVTIAVIAAILGVIVVGGVAGFFIYRKYARLSSPTHVDAQKVDQSSKDHVSQASPDGMMDDHLEEQYHPKADFDIFGRNDPFKNKANHADDLDEHDEVASNGKTESLVENNSGAADTEHQLQTRMRDSRMNESVPALGNFSTQSNAIENALQRRPSQRGSVF